MTTDFSGLVFNRWTVLRKHSAGMYECRCACGTEAVVSIKNIRNGGSKSCGCLGREVARQRHLTHGERKSRTPEYNAWMGAKRRCVDRKLKQFCDYGGRGIQMCQEWMDSYDAFLRDVGRRPGPDFSLDRIDVNGHYEPGNVRWATRRMQRLNSRNPKRGNPYLATLRKRAGLSQPLLHATPSRN
jgi:hypothetical protein